MTRYNFISKLEKAHTLIGDVNTELIKSDSTDRSHGCNIDIQGIKYYVYNNYSTIDCYRITEIDVLRNGSDTNIELIITLTNQ